MAQQQVTADELAKRIEAGEPPVHILGMTDTQLKAIIALGYNKYQQGKLDAADTMFRGAAALDPTNYLGYAGAGAVALARKPADLETAYTNLSKAAELNGDDASIQANLGEVLLRQGKVLEAKEHLEKAFQLDPDHKDPGVNRARALVSGIDAVIKEAERRKEEQLAKAS
jgi:tetratricopeptide (TPR) repeat protein